MVEVRVTARASERLVRLTLLLVVLFVITVGPAWAQEPAAPEVVPSTVEGDIVVGPGARLPAQSPGSVDAWSPVNNPFAVDPFIAWRDVTTVTGTGAWEVWRCDGPGSPGTLAVSTMVSHLDAQAVSYFQFLSRGRYTPDFVPGGSFAVGSPSGWIGDCLYDSNTPYGYGQPASSGHGYLAISEDYGSNGLGGPGSWQWRGWGGTWEWDLDPGTRQAAVGGADGASAPSVFGEWVTPIVLHEIGHGLGWPHVPIQGQDPYSNPLDIMSNGLFPTVQGTAMINLYGAGWVDRAEVATWSGGPVQVRLGTLPSSRPKMLIIPTGDARVFHTVSVQPTTFDSSSPWGVVVHSVDQRETGEAGYCPGAGTCTLISRKVQLVPPNGWDGSAIPLLTPGKTLDGEYWRVSIAATHADGYTVDLISTGFVDTVGHLFESEIDRLAAAGITRGCNPPVNSRFCPDQAVTRGQMAAFLVRALDLPAGSKVFADTDGHLFQAEISRLEAAGITRGCNPPANTRFCPDEPVTRGQMAAFLARALNLPPGTKIFADTDGHLFQSEISRLEAAGITRGCNPPSNTLFCPDQSVTRGQMAAFLVRAGLTD